MEFTDTELLAIERACLVQAHNDRQLAHNTDRPAIRNPRLASANELMAIVAQIEEDRRRRALAGQRCEHCSE